MLKFHSLRVSAVEREADDAVCVTLDVPEDLGEQFRAQAGQHVVVRAQRDGNELRRTYSLLNAAGELPLRIAVRTHAKGQFSRHIVEKLRKGDTLDVMPPNGSFGPRIQDAESVQGTTQTQVARHIAPGETQATPSNSPLQRQSAATYVAFAAGCGITPIISMIKTVLAQNPQARVLLFYGNRDRARGMLMEELLALKDRYLDRFALHFVMSREPQEVELLNGRLDGGKVRAIAGHLFDVQQVRDFFICGPGTMIDDVTGALTSLGAPANRIHSEHFTLADSSSQSAARTEAAPLASVQAGDARTANDSTMRPAASAAPVNEGLTTVNVTMDGRRRSFTMRTNDDTILEAAARAGLDLPYSCKAGVCSTCRTKLVSGKVELDQNYALEDWELEQGFILACQAHAKTPELELNYDET